MEKQTWVTLIYSPEFAWNDWRKSQKETRSVFDVPSGIRTGHLPTIQQTRYIFKEGNSQTHLIYWKTVPQFSK